MRFWCKGRGGRGGGRGRRDEWVVWDRREEGEGKGEAREEGKKEEGEGGGR